MDYEKKFLELCESAKLNDHDLPPKPTKSSGGGFRASDYMEKLLDFENSIKRQKQWMARFAIKPWPFCGSKNITLKQVYQGDDYYRCFVICKSCRARSGMSDLYEFIFNREKERVTKMWNRRAQ